MVQLSRALVIVAALFTSTFSAPVSTQGSVGAVIHDFERVGQLVVSLEKQVVHFHPGYGDGRDLHEKACEIVDGLNLAASHAEQSPPFTDDEANAIIKAMHKFAPASFHILHILISEEPKIIKLHYKDIKERVKEDLESMSKASFRFNDCVKRILPEAYLPFIDLVQRGLNEEFKKVISVY